VGIDDEEFHGLNLRETFCLKKKTFLEGIDEEFDGLNLRETLCLGRKTFFGRDR